MPAEKLRATLISILGRMITVEEMRDAMGLKASTYYDQVRENRLLSLENLRTAAHSLGINEIYLLVECGLLDRRAMEEYVDFVQQSRSESVGPEETRAAMTTPRTVREAKRSLRDSPDL